MNRGILPWLATYIAAMIALVVFMQYLRANVLREMDTPEARAEWQTWRDSQPNTQTDGPVKRKPPPSPEPPELVLMRDYFPVVMSGTVIFGSLLFGAIALAARGALSRAPATNEGRD